MSLSAISMPSSWSTTLASTRAVGIMKRASLIWWLYVESPIAIRLPLLPERLDEGEHSVADRLKHLLRRGLSKA